MQISQLGYLGFAATDLPAWRRYAEGFLGMQVIDTDPKRLALRMDERQQRFLIEHASHDGLAFAGFEVADEKGLRAAAADLTAAGVAIHESEPAERDARRVAAMIWFRDPDDNRLELYCGPGTTAIPIAAQRRTGGFRTGELGVGHVVVQTPRFSAMEKFYRDVLGFRLSDFVQAAPFRASFMHINPRHHSLAIIESDAARLHHVMVEYNYLDDVGRLYDMAQKEPGRVTVTLGRHSNDHMTSFYSRTPGGFMIETGWAGRLIDEHTWKAEALYGPSIWGHERSWLSPEAQVEARKCLQAAAERGIVEPTEVVHSPGFHLPGAGKK